MITEETSSISFENTSIAFAARSNADLRKSYLLFWLINNPSLVKLGTSMTQLALKLHLPVKGLIKRTIFSQFCGGEHVQDCRTTIKQLYNYNIGAILDYAVEGTKNEKGFEATCKEILKTIHEAASSPEIAYSVFKPTGIAPFPLLEKVHLGTALTAKEEETWQKVYQRFDTICRTAYENNVKVMIDAEESWIQNGIDEIARDMMVRYNQERPTVFNTYQLYLQNSLERLKKDFSLAEENNYFFGAKLVRGAYMEKERERAATKGYKDPVQPNKAATDNDFDKATAFCFDNRERISVVVGSHNEYSNYQLTVMMQKNGIAVNDNRFYFAQLFGMSDHISYNLADAGYNVVKYVPYGPVEKVMPYLFRRAEENTSIAGQSSREFNLIKKEMKRRRLNK